jgi:hypothetical protein
MLKVFSASPRDDRGCSSGHQLCGLLHGCLCCTHPTKLANATASDWPPPCRVASMAIVRPKLQSDQPIHRVAGFMSRHVRDSFRASIGRSKTHQTNPRARARTSSSDCAQTTRASPMHRPSRRARPTRLMRSPGHRPRPRRRVWRPGACPAGLALHSARTRPEDALPLAPKVGIFLATKTSRRRALQWPISASGSLAVLHGSPYFPGAPADAGAGQGQPNCPAGISRTKCGDA